MAQRAGGMCVRWFFEARSSSSFISLVPCVCVCVCVRERERERERVGERERDRDREREGRTHARAGMAQRAAGMCVRWFFDARSNSSVLHSARRLASNYCSGSLRFSTELLFRIKSFTK